MNTSSICPLITHSVLAQGWGSDPGPRQVQVWARRGGGAGGVKRRVVLHCAGRAVPQAQCQVPGARPGAKGRGPTLDLKGAGKRCQSPVLGPCPPTRVPCPRLGRMWWQLQEGGQDVGVGAAETKPDIRLPSSSLLPSPPPSAPSRSRASSPGTDGLFLPFRGRT